MAIYLQVVMLRPANYNYMTLHLLKKCRKSTGVVKLTMLNTYIALPLTAEIQLTLLLELQDPIARFVFTDKLKKALQNTR